jgi:two-component system sensor histidine kinase PilS (NtrC family)
MVGALLSRARAGGSRAPLAVKLTWLTFFRLVNVTVLLVGTVLTTWTLPGDPSRLTRPLYVLVIFTYAASLAFALALRAGVAMTAVAYAQIVLDVCDAAGLVALTGGADSVFVFLFSLAIVNGSILLFRRGAVAATLLSFVGYAAVTFAAGRPPDALAGFAHAGAFVATAALSSFLAEQLRRTGERLVAREGDLAAITGLHEAIVQSVSSGIIGVDQGGRITFANRAAEQILGVSAEALLGAPHERTGIALAGMALAGGRDRDETYVTNARGDRLLVGYTLSPIVDGGGARRGTAVIFQDLTRLREMEDAMKRSERLADLGELSAGLAHELRNPLASLTGAIELIRGRLPGGSDDRRLTDIVLREAARLEQLVSRFHEFGRPAPPVHREVALEDLVRDTARMFSHHPSAAAVRVEEDVAPARALGDPDQLRQVAWNLLVNAVEAVTAAGAEPVVRLACGTGPAGWVWFEVEDHGPGIPAGDVDRLFTPFFTTKAQGSGLGLAIVQRIVDAHDGLVELDTEPGRGTTLRVRVPAAAPVTAVAASG